MTLIRRLFIMKKNKKGFTLIELLVVVAIIGILAGLLIPGLMNKTVDAKIKTANSNAKLVYSSTANALQQATIDEPTWLPTSATTASGTGGANADPTTLVTAIQKELGSSFKGNWFVSIADDGNVVFALWSNSAISESTQQSKKNIKDKKGVLGCYPTTD